MNAISIFPRPGGVLPLWMRGVNAFVGIVGSALIDGVVAWEFVRNVRKRLEGSVELFAAVERTDVWSSFDIVMISLLCGASSADSERVSTFRRWR